MTHTRGLVTEDFNTVDRCDTRLSIHNPYFQTKFTCRLSNLTNIRDSHYFIEKANDTFSVLIRKHNKRYHLVRMSVRRDSRPQSVKAKISWNIAWMGVRDAQGDYLGDWAIREDFQTYKCRWCQKVCIYVLCDK